MDSKEERQVFLGLGSNLGDRRENLLSALRLLHVMEGIKIRDVSSVYETKPWGVLKQPDFLNLVALADTTRDPRGVLSACGEVEDKIGRVRGERWGPRLIDVDILLFDDLELEEEGLVIPHPRMFERDFVMVPLLELRPDLSPPGGGDAGLKNSWEGRAGIRLAFRFDKEEWHG
jgi:2-amino-4-hydroxy-6-hydroxymethyldihydropteridine diphosphokinase